MLEPRPKLLIVDDKPSMLQLLERILASYFDVVCVADGSRAILAAEQSSFAVVLSDVRMVGMDGFAVLKSIKQVSPATEVILMTAYATIPSAVEAIKEGAFDYLPKPFDPDDVALVVARAVKRHRDRAARGFNPDAPVPEDLSALSYREAVERSREHGSRAYLVALLRELKGNVTRAAERAGIERESLHRLLKRYGLHSDDFKDG